jgi:hypothetical protein
MKSLIKAVAIAAVLAIPAVSFAQSNQPVTRAQVRNELIQLEKAGYNPADIQAAEAKVQAQNGNAVAQAPVADTGYGAATNGSSQSGAAVKPMNPTQDVYFGH